MGVRGEMETVWRRGGLTIDDRGFWIFEVEEMGARGEMDYLFLPPSSTKRVSIPPQIKNQSSPIINHQSSIPPPSFRTFNLKPETVHGPTPASRSTSRLVASTAPSASRW